MPANKKNALRKRKEDRAEDKSASNKVDKSEARRKSRDKKNTSLRLDKQTLKALKIHAIENETSIQNLIESMIKDYLKKKSRDKYDRSLSGIMSKKI
jgi:hypothetical protein